MIRVQNIFVSAVVWNFFFDKNVCGIFVESL